MSSYRPSSRRHPRPPAPTLNSGSKSRGGGRRDEYRSKPNSHSGPESSYRGNHSHTSSQSALSGYDTFRPPQSDFTFRAEKPPGIDDKRLDHSRPARSGAGRGDKRHDHKGRRSGQDQTRFLRDGIKGFNRRPRVLPADRPILSTIHSINQELSFVDATNGVTYRALDELSDSDEAEMEISEDDESSGEASGPSQKKARMNSGALTSGNSVPKWSNPDPYTALPPPDISQQKKKDVVQLIRKARVLSAVDAKPTVPTEAADFISCNMDDSDEDEDVEGYEDAGQDSDMLSKERRGEKAREAGPRSGAEPKTSGSFSTGSNNARGSTQNELHEPSSPISRTTRGKRVDLAPSQSLGSRKRTHDDTIKPAEHAGSRGPRGEMSRVFIIDKWLPVSGQDHSPWLTTNSSLLSNIGVWLHKEIVDFYNYVKPRQFEQDLRQRLVDDLGKLVRGNFRDATVYPFGSFMSGLYLPTGDMDLAFCSDSYINGNRAKYDPKGADKKIVYKLAGFLKRRSMAQDDQITCILHAKVPLVKYVDSRTGLSVDISFENTTGTQAIKTFKIWQAQFPAMPVLVVLIKHFLAMRGLNEPVNGGIGGFSVTCLVVSMLQLMPDVESRSLIPEHHLGVMLMEFFDLYGNRFDFETTAIRVNPPGYVPKTAVKTLVYRNLDRLSIIDPNNPENDISGGSKNIRNVAAAFSQAHRLLQERMSDLAQSSERLNASILEVILSGNYSSIETQREHLRSIWENSNRAPAGPSRKR